MVREISEWLERLNLGQYAKSFADNDVDKDLLLELSEDDLVKLGVTSLGHRKRLSKEIAALRSQLPAAAPAATQGADEAERRQLTVMFCDLVGSTELSGRLDPEDLRGVFRRYQNAVTTAVLRYGGHVGQYLGDGVLVYFGWPHAYEDQAERAIWASLEAIANVKQVTVDSDTTLNARAGIASGPVVIGEFVDHTGQDVQAVTGKTPNLAARLQGLAEPGQVVIDAHTRRLVGTAFRLEACGDRVLKGFPRPVSVWQVTGRGQAESRFAAAHSGSLSRFIGRTRELRLLEKHWSQARQARGQAVLLCGEAGIGKSRLVQAFWDSIADEKCLRLSSQCSPLHTNSAFHPIIQLLERLAEFGADDDDTARLDKLEALLERASMQVESAAPLIATLLSLPAVDRYGPLDLAPQQVRERTIELLLTLLIDLGRDRPVVFLLEDAHWIDPTTETLVGAATKRIADASVLMLVTHRLDYAPNWAREPAVAKIDLHKLSRDQGAELVRAAGGELEEPVIGEILARADGVPLFIEELTKSLLESDEAEIPASLQASLVARLDRLGDAAKVAQLAALLGRSFHYRFIREVSELPDAELDRALTAMTESELLTQTGTPPRAVYVFRHALIQDAAYETLLKSRRARYHGRTAEVLLREFASQAAAEPELVARHWSLAGQPGKAADFWLKAGQRAGERSAHIEAVAHLERGLQEIDALPRSKARDRREFAIRIALGASLLTLKGWSSSQVEKNYQRAVELSASGNGTHDMLIALRGLTNVFFLKGEIRKARKLADRELAIAEEQDDRTMLLGGYRSVGMCSFFAGRFEAARDYLGRAVDIYDPEIHHGHRFVHGTDPAVIGCSVLGWTGWFLGDFDAARREMAAALALADELQHPFSLAYAKSLAASVHQGFREPETALEQAEAAIAISEEQGYPYWIGWSSVLRGWAMAALGKPADGIAALRRGLEIYESTGAQQVKPYILTLLAEMHGWAGLPEDGLEVLRGAIRPGNKTDVIFYEAEALRIEGELRRQSGSGDSSELFDRALSMARRQRARTLELRGALSAARLVPDRRAGSPARDRLARILESFDGGLRQADVVDARSFLDS